MPQDSADPFSRLPKEVLVNILQQLPQDARLRDCACVNRMWHAATLATLSSITAKLKATTARSLPFWLLTYGTAAQVSHLNLNLAQGRDRAVLLSSQVGSALAGLPGLSKLELSGLWHAGSVNLPASTLPNMQELILDLDSMRGIGLLPRSLTSLELSQDLWMWELLSSDPIPEDRSDQPPLPALRSLTNLEKLTVKRTDISVTFDAVAQLPKLRTCIISQHSIAVPEEPDFPTGLAAISTLTSLEHLDLAKWLCPSLRKATPVLTCADCSALTASTQLTFLDLSAWQLSRDLCAAVFPEGLQLPHLQDLHLGPSFLQTPAATAALASTAPNLTALAVSAASSTNFYEDADYEEYVVSGLCVEGLEGLTTLQTLDLSDVRVINPGIWDTLAQISTLTSIHVGQAGVQCMPGILGLSVLEGLQQLSVNLAWCKDSGLAEGIVNVSSTPEDGPLFWQLPAAVVNCAAGVLEMAVEEEVAPAAALLLDACPATCTAAMDAFLQLEQRVRGGVCEGMEGCVAWTDAHGLPEAARLQKHLSGWLTVLENTLPSLRTPGNASTDANAVSQQSQGAGTTAGRHKLLKVARRQLAESKGDVRALAHASGMCVGLLEQLVSVKSKLDACLDRQGQKLQFNCIGLCSGCQEGVGGAARQLRG